MGCDSVETSCLDSGFRTLASQIWPRNASNCDLSPPPTSPQRTDIYLLTMARTRVYLSPRIYGSGEVGTSGVGIYPSGITFMWQLCCQGELVKATQFRIHTDTDWCAGAGGPWASSCLRILPPISWPLAILNPNTDSGSGSGFLGLSFISYLSPSPWMCL